MSARGGQLGRWKTGQVDNWTGGQVTTALKGRPNMCRALIMS